MKQSKAVRRLSGGCKWVVLTIAVVAICAGTADAQQAEASKAFAKELSAAFRHAAREVLPSVVSIQQIPKPDRSAHQRRPQSPAPQVPEENPFKGTPFEEFFDEFHRRHDRHPFHNPRRGPAGMGSGVIIDPAGVILTNNHVVAGDFEIRVRLKDDREFTATKVATDPRTDLAIVWIEGAKELKAAQLGDSDVMDIGDWVLAVGHPFGLFESVTAGIISAKGRGIGVAMREDFLQTDAAINPGNSGGPLINLDGEVVGINTAISSRTGGYQGAGFAIPINLAKWVIRQLIDSGSVRRAYLGAAIHTVTQELSEQFGVKVGAGVVINEVFSGSPAADAGLKPGDVVTTFAGKPVRDPRDLVAAVETSKIDSKQSVTIIRDGKQTELVVTVREQPKDYGLRVARPPEGEEERERATFEDLGLEVGPLTAEAAEQIGVTEKDGVLITKVAPDSPASLAGLAPGMVITEANRNGVESLDDLRAAIKERAPGGKGVLLLVRTARGSRFVVLQVE
ncbi:MAG: trypsin-like peptidase domain-containing protein [Pirellulales bacterium]